MRLDKKEEQRNQKRKQRIELAMPLIDVIRMALQKKMLDEAAMKELDPEKLWRQAGRHSIRALCAQALDPAFLPEMERIRWKDASASSLSRALRFQKERRKLYAYCDAHQIWYLPLKGIVLQDCYPALGAREMSDNDILFDASCREQIREYFEGKGYQTVAYALGSHDVYQKEPIYNFEMHVELFSADAQPVLARYYEELFSWPGKEGWRFKENGRMETQLSAEEFTVYCFLHFWKHYSHSGSGLRSLIDLDLCLERMEPDRRIVCQKLSALGLLTEFQTAQSLVNKLFHGSDSAPVRIRKLTPEEESMLGFVLESGTYGTYIHHLENQLRELSRDGTRITVQAKLRMVYSIIFPGKDHLTQWIELYIPWLKWVPFARVWVRPIRWGYLLVHYPRQIQSRLKAVRNA